MNGTFQRRSFIPALALALGLAGFSAPAVLAHTAAAAPPAAHQQQKQAIPDPPTVSVTGCLQESSGQFLLTARSGGRYILNSAPSIDLGAIVGHTVTVTGSLAAGRTGGARTLNVSQVKQVGSACRG